MHYIFQGSRSKDLRDRVMVVLAEHEPLKAREIYTLLKRRYRIPETYQAVHKALGTMVTAGILERKRFKYKLNKAWVGDMSKLLSYIQEKRVGGNENK